MVSQKIAPLFCRKEEDKVFRRGYFLSQICKGGLKIVHGNNAAAVSRKGGEKWDYLIISRWGKKG
jgi:hypothetical protein